MHDLRRQALLESGKTVSRKARSREASQQTSRANSTQNSRQNSRQSSRAVSRYASDDEDNGSGSDDTTAYSTTSLDDLAENPEADNIDWSDELVERIQDILDRKRSSVQGREELLSDFCRLTKYHYAEEVIRNHVEELVAAFSRSVKYQPSAREATLALKALEILAVTADDDAVYDNVEPLLSSTIQNATSTVIKAAAIHCLGTCAYFCGSTDEDRLDQMNFFLDIVATDGGSIDATDDAAAVTAALQQWGLLATDLEDVEAESEEYIQCFIEQLERSKDVGVLVAAGENIALLYEKSLASLEDIAEDEDDEEEDNGNHNAEFGQDRNNITSDDDADSPPVKQYEPYHHRHQLEELLSSLASATSKQFSKKDKKSLHSNFSSILLTVHDPRCGPMFHNAVNWNTGLSYGHKRQVKIGKEGFMVIDEWWKWLRLEALRRILQGGFIAHYYQGNRSVLNMLPVMLRRPPRDRRLERVAARKAAKIRRSLTEGDDSLY